MKIMIEVDSLKNLRRARGFNLRQASDATGISKSTLSRHENGETNLDIEDIISLAKGYKVSPEQITNLLIEEVNKYE